METKRNPYFDELKGLTILLVVIGHVIQYVYAPSDFDHNIVFRVIYSFHMALFFLISGYVNNISASKLTWRKTWRRIFSLYCPFIFWGVIDKILKSILHHEGGGVICLMQ